MFTAPCRNPRSLSLTRASQGDSVIRPRFPIAAYVSAACSLLPKTVVIKLQDAGMFKHSTPENPARDCIKANECIEWLQQQVFFFALKCRTFVCQLIFFKFLLSAPNYVFRHCKYMRACSLISPPNPSTPNSSYAVSLQLKYSRTRSL